MTNKKLTKKQTGELLFGIHPIVELLKAKRRKLLTIYTTRPEPKAWATIEPLLPKYPFNLQFVGRDVMNNIAGTTDHQNVVAWAGPFPTRKQMFNPAKHTRLIMLDGIQDPHNLGAILRSTYCTGFDGVILIQKGASPLTASAHKASAGLAEHMEIFIAPSASAALQELKKAGYTCYMAVFNGNDATTVHYKTPLCLVIGGEGFGISKEIINQGEAITLPQRTKDISYNASVAAGILLFLIGSQKS